MSQEALLPDLPNVDWSKLWDAILTSLIHALTEVNNWSIRHPYVAAGALICISANPDVLLTPLRLAGRTTLYICLLPLRLILWPLKLFGRFTLYILGFRRCGVARDSLASQYQSHIYGGYVPQDSTFARFQSYGAADYYDDMEALRLANAEYENINQQAASKRAVGPGVSWLSAIGAVLVLSRTWGWWN
ncbi:hypothetical protein BDR04DRAFT_1235072 [Suillus decipiens]|nr:hypothetical protein BDR04DRAFT_1235072 [Suillus decipiens]